MWSEDQQPQQPLGARQWNAKSQAQNYLIRRAFPQGLRTCIITLKSQKLWDRPWTLWHNMWSPVRIPPPPPSLHKVNTRIWAANWASQPGPSNWLVPLFLEGTSHGRIKQRPWAAKAGQDPLQQGTVDPKACGEAYKWHQGCPGVGRCTTSEQEARQSTDKELLPKFVCKTLKTVFRLQADGR